MLPRVAFVVTAPLGLGLALLAAPFLRSMPQSEPSARVESFELDGLPVGHACFAGAFGTLANTPTPTLPSAYSRAHQGERLQASFEICRAPDGTVDSIAVVDGLDSDTDAELMTQIWQGWHLGVNAPPCFVRSFVFTP